MSKPAKSLWGPLCFRGVCLSVCLWTPRFVVPFSFLRFRFPILPMQHNGLRVHMMSPRDARIFFYQHLTVFLFPITIFSIRYFLSTKLSKILYRFQIKLWSTQGLVTPQSEAAGNVIVIKRNLNCNIQSLITLKFYKAFD